MSKCILIFVRHKLTTQQLDELLNISDYCPSKDIIRDCYDLALCDITDTPSLERVWEQLQDRIGRTNPPEVYAFGVFPAPLRNKLFHENLRQIWYIHEAWNIKRSQAGQPPTFLFNGWLLTQILTSYANNSADNESLYNEN